jgi:hypothetical protein
VANSVQCFGPGGAVIREVEVEGRFDITKDSEAAVFKEETEITRLSNQVSSLS